jgi:hypothetical protein
MLTAKDTLPVQLAHLSGDRVVAIRAESSRRSILVSGTINFEPQPEETPSERQAWPTYTIGGSCQMGSNSWSPCD